MAVTRVGSLFSGIGGFDLGFERAGFEIAWQCEIDRHARKVLAKHWPRVECYEDIRSIDGASIPRVDVICGGFPCQDLSVAGKRAGLAGERSGLWFEFYRIVGEHRPEWVVIENVPGLRSSNGGRDLAIILQGLAELGYMGSWWSPDAQHFGLAQRRERVFIVGHLGSGRAVEVLPDTESLCGHPPPRREAGKDVAGTLGGSSQRGGFRTTDLDNNGAYIVAEPITANQARTYSNAGNNPKPHNLVFSVRTAQTSSNGWGVDEHTAYALDGAHGQAVAFAQNQRGGGGTPGGGYAAIYVPQVVGTLSDGAHHGGGLNGQDAYTGRVIAPDAAVVRRLTPLECERLQGFPDGWTDIGQADSHRYRQLGNAVAVPVAEWVARRIREVAG